MMPLHDEALEWGVVIACCTRPSVVGPVLQRVRPEDFWDQGARAVMTVVARLHAQGVVVDKELVSREIRGADPTAGLTLFDTRYELSVPEAAPGHALHVRKLSMLRKVRSAGAEMHEVTEDDDPRTVINEAIEALRAAGEDLGSDEMTMADLIADLEQGIDQDAQEGLGTGIPTLDRQLEGLRPTRLYVVGARPGVGKSALVTNWIRLALDEARTVLFCSLEMTGREVLRRMVNERFGLRTARPTDPAYVSALFDGMHHPEVTAWPLHYLGTSGITNVIRRARELKPEGLGLVVVDYLQLLPSERRAERRELEVSSYTRALKLLAMEVEVPVIAVSQLNRNPESRPDRKPRLADLRESGAVEQDANVVMLLHRDVDNNSPDAELIVAKNRHGKTGSIPLVFDGELTRFRERYKPGSIGEGAA